MRSNLTINFINVGGRAVEGTEQVISAPFDEVASMIILIDSSILVRVFNEAPTEHGHGIGQREVELGVLSRVIVSSN